MLMNDPKNSNASAGKSGIDTAPRPEQNSSGRRLISTTSAYRVATTKCSVMPIIGSSIETGRNALISRSSAKRAMRSSSGIRQNSVSTSSAKLASLTRTSFRHRRRDFVRDRQPRFDFRVVTAGEDVRHAAAMGPAASPAKRSKITERPAQAAANCGATVGTRQDF